MTKSTLPLPLDLGAPVGLPPKTPTEADAKQATAENQKHLCGWCGLPFDKLDVVAVGNALVGYCRSDRVKRDQRQAAEARRAGRRTTKRQQEFAGTRRRRAKQVAT